MIHARIPSQLSNSFNDGMQTRRRLSGNRLLRRKLRVRRRARSPVALCQKRHCKRGGYAKKGDEPMRPGLQRLQPPPMGQHHFSRRNLSQIPLNLPQTHQPLLPILKPRSRLPYHIPLSFLHPRRRWIGTSRTQFRTPQSQLRKKLVFGITHLTSRNEPSVVSSGVCGSKGTLWVEVSSLEGIIWFILVRVCPTLVLVAVC